MYGSGAGIGLRHIKIRLFRTQQGHSWARTRCDGGAAGMTHSTVPGTQERSGSPVDYRSDHLGLRLVRTLESSQ